MTAVWPPPCHKPVALDTALQPSCFAMRFEPPQTGLLSLLGLSDHEDTPHRRLVSGIWWGFLACRCGSGQLKVPVADLRRL
jgi:hypothetical protein